MQLKVSVIMGIYNCASTLCEALDSLLIQSYTDWELIMCDDGSIDNTYDVAEFYSKKYNNIYIFRNGRNMGLNYTLNQCLNYAKGKYIARMDGDDISLPTRFEEEVKFLDEHPEYAIVSTPLQYFDQTGVFGIGKGGKEPNARDFPKGTPFAHAAAIVRREAYEKVGGYSVSDKFLRVEDWQLWIKMYAAGYKGYVMDKPLYKMRDDGNALTRRTFRYRLNEACVSAFAVKTLCLPAWMYVFSARPILIGLLPKSLYTLLHRINLYGSKNIS